MKIILLALLLLISPILWLVLGNIPADFKDTTAWFYLMNFVLVAFAIFIALDSNKKNN